jgi:hypothetical protein
MMNLWAGKYFHSIRTRYLINLLRVKLQKASINNSNNNSSSDNSSKSIGGEERGEKRAVQIP